MVCIPMKEIFSFVSLCCIGERLVPAFVCGISRVLCPKELCLSHRIECETPFNDSAMELTHFFSRILQSDCSFVTGKRAWSYFWPCCLSHIIFFSMSSVPPSHWWWGQGGAQAFRAGWRFCFKASWCVLWGRKIKRQSPSKFPRFPPFHQGFLRPFPAALTAPSSRCSPRGGQSVKAENHSRAQVGVFSVWKE